MDEKLYKIKKGSEFDFYSTESSGTINKIVGKTTQETEIAPLITVNKFSQLELDRDDTMRKVSIDPTSDDITQATREGYNLLSTENLQELNKNGIVLTKENGIITINGQNTSANFIDDYFIGSSSNYEEFLTAGTYLISGITGGVLSPNFGIIVVIKHVDESTTTIIQNSVNKSFTVREDDTFRIFIRIPQNLQLSNVVIKPMIVAGTEEKPYEQYGASPSLDYPSEFENITTAQNIQVLKKNILNTNGISSTGNIVFTSKSNGALNINGTASGTWKSLKTQILKVPIKAGTKIFTNYGKTTSLSQDNTDFRPFLWLYNENDSTFKNIYGSDSVVLEQDLYKIVWGIEKFVVGNTYNEDIYIEVEISDTRPTKFNQYDGYSKSIALPENKFLGNFNGYKNYIKDSKLKSNLKIITLDGTEKYTIQSTETNTIRFKLDLSLDTNVVLDNTNLNYLCNYLKAYKYNESTEDKEGIFIGATTSSIEIYMRVPLNEIASIDDFKEFLSSKAITEEPFKILLQCGEEEISLEDINLPLYNGINNIFAENSNISFYPYADMPSLERPSVIESISGDYTINIHGENFLQDQWSSTNLAQYNWCFDIKANLKPDTTYTISLIGAIDNRYYVSEQLVVGGGIGFAFTMTGERQSITFTTKSDISGAYNSSRQMYNIFKNAKRQPHEHIFKDVMLVEGSVAKDYVPYVSSTTTIELPEGVELNKLNLEDYVKQDGTITVNNKRITLNGTENWGFNTEANRFDIYNLPISILDVPQAERKQLCTHFKTYNPYATSQGSFSVGTGFIRIYNDNNMTLEEWKTYLAQQNEAGTPVEIVYTSREPTKSVIPTTEVTKMQLFPVIIGENHLVAPSEVVLLYYDEREEEEDIQPITITNEGKLLPFNLLVDYNKTDLPLIAEAIEASQTITGADGDLVLDTTYGSRLFEIDAVTDDFLTPEQKEAKREEIREFLNSIKKVNTKLIIEPQNRTYEVKYAGLAEDTNLPKCVEFLIPLKSASAYAISNTTYTLEGEGEIESETKAPAGFVCTISGPSNYPELALNGYLMAYENVILEGEKLIIDTKKSTVTKISTTGVKTNAMVYYNHQFPRIQEGLNLFTIISGIDEDKLKIEWNDLLL